MKKIMFNDKYGLTQAVLKGRKTMTRRIVTDRKLHYWESCCPNMLIVKAPESIKTSLDDTNTYFGIKEKASDCYYCDTIISPYKIGEIIAVAQSYHDLGYDKDSLNRDSTLKIRGTLGQSAGWKNKMFVRADACKHHICITDIKIERLQEISDEDCLKEGIIKQAVLSDESPFLYAYDVYENGSAGYFASQWFKSSRDAFAILIDKICGKNTWERNSWVFAYEFKLLN